MHSTDSAMVFRPCKNPFRCAATRYEGIMSIRASSLFLDTGVANFFYEYIDMSCYLLASLLIFFIIRCCCQFPCRTPHCTCKRPQAHVHMMSMTRPRPLKARASRAAPRRAHQEHQLALWAEVVDGWKIPPSRSRQKMERIRGISRLRCQGAGGDPKNGAGWRPALCMVAKRCGSGAGTIFGASDRPSRKAPGAPGEQRQSTSITGD